jgi:hypothetical protein
MFIKYTSDNGLHPTYLQQDLSLWKRNDLLAMTVKYMLYKNECVQLTKVQAVFCSFKDGVVNLRTKQWFHSSYQQKNAHTI